MTATERDAAMADRDPGAVAGAVRCSDYERERVSSRLYVAAGEGRLTMDEVSDRLGVVYAARFRHELDGLTTDLPAAEPRVAGWAAIGAMISRQLAADLDLLTRASTDDAERRRKILTVLAIIGALLIAGAMFALMLHGFANGEHAEHVHHGFG